MKLFWMLFTFILFLTASAAHAQKQLVQGGLRALQKEAAASVQKAGAARKVLDIAKVSSRQTAAAELPPAYAENLIRAARAAAQTARLEELLPYALFTAASSKNAAPATGFVIAEEYKGKTILWGVVSRHVLRATGNAPVITFTVDGNKYAYQTYARVLGTKRGADIALLELPPVAYDVVRPLPLRTDPVQPGEETFSAGFASGKFIRADHRTVLVSTPLRIITSYRLQGMERDGYCGSPLFDAHNRVVGVHCGSYFPQRDRSHWYAPLADENPQLAAELARHSQAVPVSWVQNLLDRYRTRPAKQPVVFNGVTLAEIAADEYISAIYIFHDGYVAARLTPDPLLDYNHLENALPLHKGNRIAIEISKDAKSGSRPPVRFETDY